MNDKQIGSTLRALRRRTGLRQRDIARLSGVSQQLISSIERGGAATVVGQTLKRIFAAVEADAVTVIHWRGGELDRLLDEGHADIVGRVVALLQARGWTVFPEVTFSEWGERGSIDILAWHEPSRTLLVIEVKTEITSIEEMLRKHDEKFRLAPGIASKRFGMRPRTTARLLVIAESPTNRRRVDRMAAVINASYPDRGPGIRAWLRNPAGPLSGVLFLTGAPDRATRARRRIRTTDRAAQ